MEDVVTCGLKYYYINMIYPYVFIYRWGCILPLPFKFITECGAFGAALKLEMRKTTVAKMYFYDKVVGNRPLHSKPLKFEEWCNEQYKDYFNKWEIEREVETNENH